MAEGGWNLDTLPGRPMPLGCSMTAHGWNFAVFSRHATGVSLLLCSADSPATVRRVVDLDPACQRTGDVWHVAVTGLPPGAAYGWRVAGPYEPDRGHRFNAAKVLLDPCAEALVGTAHWADGEDVEPAVAGVRCLVPQTEEFDWQNDCPPGHAWEDTIIYETHVRGFSIDGSSGVTHPGTFLGVIDKIPYFLSLGSPRWN